MADDSYLSIATIASDEHMTQRLNACATQQQHLGSIEISAKWGETPGNAQTWVADSRYLWAASPGWGAAWDYALNSHPNQPDYQPGADPAVITDQMILSAIQTLAPKTP